MTKSPNKFMWFHTDWDRAQQCPETGIILNEKGLTSEITSDLQTVLGGPGARSQVSGFF